MNMSNKGKALLTLLAGAAIGAGLGILYAPEKGTKTRKKIKHKVDDASHDMAERLSHAKDEMAKTVEQKKHDFDRKLDEAMSSMSSKADGIISSVEGKLKKLNKKSS